MQVRTLCLCHLGGDPNLTMSLVTFMTPPLPPSTPPPAVPQRQHTCRRSPGIGIVKFNALAKMLILTILSTDVLQRCQKLALLAMAEFSGRVALLTKQTVHPSSQGVYLWLACQQRRTALRTALFQKAPKGGPYFPHRCRSQNMHIIVIFLVINIYIFSSCNNVDLLCSMSTDCCMPRHQEWGTMAAMGGQQPPAAMVGMCVFCLACTRPVGQPLGDMQC